MAVETTGGETVPGGERVEKEEHQIIGIAIARIIESSSVSQSQESSTVGSSSESSSISTQTTEFSSFMTTDGTLI